MEGAGKEQLVAIVLACVIDKTIQAALHSSALTSSSRGSIDTSLSLQNTRSLYLFCFSAKSPVDRDGEVRDILIAPHAQQFISRLVRNHIQLRRYVLLFSILRYRDLTILHHSSWHIFVVPLYASARLTESDVAGAGG